MTSGTYRNFFTPIFGIILLVTVFSVSNTDAILASLGNARLELVFLGLCLIQIQIILSALRWCYTAAQLDHPLPPASAIADYYLGSFLNMVLPGGVVGDMMRAARSRSADRKWSIPVLAVLLERFAGQIALFFVGGLGFILWPFLDAELRPSEALALVLAAIGALIVIATVSLLIWLSGSLWWRNFIRKIGRSITVCYGLPYAWLVQGVLSLTIVISYIAVFAMASVAIGAPLPLIGLITAIPLCLLTMVFPITVGGWGTREAAAAVLWPLLGLTGDQGIAASVLYGAIVTLGTLPGLALFIWSTSRRR
ncbi:lysylphosphatidylglycerol synthase transmembrane domain-containing protein [Phyllobacterium sp. CCNWLW109]|uniref:lysylphosphatidylglycerol synthase transmembrane domain-containing protein n=1 Tax=Phyllobacterium sp. CCNWLW109 TaxID=3127479 RepID=UPI003076D605